MKPAGKEAPHRTTARTLAAFGTGWSLLFAVAHYYWGAGGRLGVPGTATSITARPWFLAYDLAAGIVFTLATVVGFVLASGRGGAVLRRRLLTATGWGAVLALLRGFGGLLQDVVTLSAGHSPGFVFYDIWFAVAGIVFFLAARGFCHRRGADVPRA